MLSSTANPRSLILQILFLSRKDIRYIHQYKEETLLFLVEYHLLAVHHKHQTIVSKEKLIVEDSGIIVIR